jgi:hypothetical protein
MPLKANSIDINDRYLDLKGLAEYSSLSVNSLRQYLSDPDDPIPSFCIKRKKQVKLSEFNRWMEKRRTDTKQVDTIVDEILNDLK